MQARGSEERIQSSGASTTIHHIHFFVPDAVASQAFFCQAIGMEMVRRVETEDRITFLLSHASTWFLLSSPRTGTSPVAMYLQTHAPGVADVALEVEDLTSVMSLAERFCLGTASSPAGLSCFAGEAPASDPPQALGQLPELLELSPQARWGWIPGWGSVSHTLVQRSPAAPVHPPQRSVIDHVVLNVPAGALDSVATYYERLFGFERRQTFRIRTARSGLRSQVLSDPSTELYLNINEPSCDRSQIQDFIAMHHGAGIQHIALRCQPILERVPALRRQGMPLLPAPPAYYERLLVRLMQSPEVRLHEHELRSLIENEILIDWQPGMPASVLLQIFSLPIFAGSLFFFEFIERRGKLAQGFGERNFQALYEAVEAELLHRQECS